MLVGIVGNQNSMADMVSHNDEVRTEKVTIAGHVAKQTNKINSNDNKNKTNKDQVVVVMV